LSEWIDVDADVSRVDRIVNDRGVYFDAPLARALLAADERNAHAALQEYAGQLGEFPGELATTVSSPAQFAAATGYGDAKAETIDEIIACAAPGSPRYEHNSRPYWFAMARRALASIARGKLEAGLTRASDDSRLRDTHRYYGGHTGRWSGKGMQLQNMPRPAPRFEKLWKDLGIDKDAVAVGAWIDALADRVIRGIYLPTQDEIDLLLRATICAAPGKTLAVCDFSGVEARALAWASGDLKALEVIASGKDAYKIEAANIYGCSYDDVDKAMRGIGKVAVLACGYGMGHAKMYANNSAALEAAGIDPKEVVDAWRKLHAPSVRFWRDCEDALVLAIGGRPSKVSCFDFCPSDNGRDVAVYLPSGRPIVYREARCSDTVTSWGATKSSPSFLSTKGMREHTYGGKIVENLIQAMCRDLMADALVRVDDAGLSPVMHVHDEIVCEVDGAQGAVALEYLHEIMTTLPSWATGFPVGAAGFHARRYRK
jgi:DNA polymerase